MRVGSYETPALRVFNVVCTALQAWLIAYTWNVGSKLYDVQIVVLKMFFVFDSIVAIGKLLF